MLKHSTGSSIRRKESTMKNEQQDKAALIFRAHQGDRDVYDFVTIDEVTTYRHAETFDEFLKVNQIKTYEEVIR